MNMQGLCLAPSKPKALHPGYLCFLHSQNGLESERPCNAIIHVFWKATGNCGNGKDSHLPPGAPLSVQVYAAN